MQKEATAKQKMAQNNDVDINVLISIYNQKLSTISNQNVLLEAKIQTITQDFLEEKTELLRQLKEIQDKHDNLLADLEEDDGETSK
mgnify:CR=1 FL=1